MAASQVIETFQLGSAQSVKREGASASSAEKSHDFENIFDKANKSYTSEKPSQQKSAAENTQNVSSQQVDKTPKEQNAKPKDGINKQEFDNNAAKTDSNVEDSSTESTDSSDSLPIDAEMKSNSDVNEKVKGESVKMDIESQTSIIENIQPEVVTSKEELQVEDIKDVKADTQSVLVEDVSFEQVAKKIEGVVISPNNNDNKSEEVSSETLVSDSQNDIKVESEESAPQSPIIIAAETLDLMAKAAIDNLSAQQPINAVSNSNIQQNASIQGIENSALFEKMVPNNAAKQGSNESAILPTQKSALLNAQTPAMSVGALQQEQNSSPVVQVATDALNVTAEADSSTSGIVSDIKENGKKTLTQEVVDSLDVKVSSVKTTTSSNTHSGMDSNNNQNNNSHNQGLLAQQNTQDQAVMLELQSSSNIEAAPSVGTIDTSAVTQVDLSATSQVNTASVQSQNVHIAKEITHSDIMEQINKQLDLKNSMSAQNGETTKVNIVLRPENLGKVELELISTKDGLIAKLTAENAQVKEALDKNLDGLKDSLGAQGVNVNTVSVKINEAQKQDTMFSFDKQPGQDHSNQQQNSKQAQEGRFQSGDDTGEIDDIIDDSILGVDSDVDVAQSVNTSGNVDYKI